MISKKRNKTLRINPYSDDDADADDAGKAGNT